MSWREELKKKKCFGTGQDFALFAVHCCHHCNLIKTANMRLSVKLKNLFLKYILSEILS